MKQLSLKETFQILWERKSTLILITAIFMVLGYIYSAFIITPKYMSFTTLVLTESVESGTETIGNILNSKTISTYNKLIKSNSIIRQIISRLGIKDSEESIKKNISVTTESDTEILKIKVENEEPQKAADIANETAVVFAEELKRLYGIDNVHTVDLAEVSSQPSNINYAKTIIVFGIVALILSAVYILTPIMLDNTIKTVEDVEKNINIPVLASIPVYKPRAKSRSRMQRNTRGGKRR